MKWSKRMTEAASSHNRLPQPSTYAPGMVVRALIGVLAFALVGCNGGNQTPPAQGGAPAVSDEQLVMDNNRGVGLMGQFKYEPARVIFERLADVRPDNEDVRVNLAIATLNRQLEGDEVRALTMLEEVLADHPDQVRANYCAGLLKLYQGPPADPLPHFERVVQQRPDDAYSVYLLGQCLENVGRAEDAFARYQQSLELDSYLASAHLGMSRTLRRMEQPEQAREHIALFQTLQQNPGAHVFEFVYSKMGAFAEARAFNVVQPEPAPEPEGEVFEPPVFPALTGADAVNWRDATDDPPDITAVDIDHDDDIDLFFAGGITIDEDLANALLLNNGSNEFTVEIDHPLARVTDVNAALWGDYDNDGLTDVYLCRRGANQLWRQSESGWSDVTISTLTGGGDFNTVGGALFDADHDGDLDIFCVNADGPNELLSNNLNGTFRAIAQERGIDGGDRASSQVLVTDLDNDRDADIIVIHDEPPHDVFRNELLWEYTPATGFDALRNEPIAAIVAADFNADGTVELVTHSVEDRLLTHWRKHESGQWVETSDGDPVNGYTLPPGWNKLAVFDANGDGQLNAPRQLSLGWQILDPEDLRDMGEADVNLGRAIPDDQTEMVRAWEPVVLDPHRGYSIVGVKGDGMPLVWRPGPGRHQFFVSLTFAGKDDSDTMRSNASGIGTHFAARMQSRWIVGDTFRNTSGPGQSLQPIAIGTGGSQQIDFVEMEWSDGVFQSELALEPGIVHAIVETQRQLSSCPVLFAWNGSRYEFVTDLLGVGGMGYMVAPGEYAPPRPWENVMMPAESLAARDGRFIIKLTEPMEEACYFDHARLVAYDLPPGWSMTLDERMGISDPQPTGEVRFYRHEIEPVRAVNDRGEDETDAIRDVDHHAADVGDIDPRFIGLLQKEFALTLEFDQRLDAIEGALILIADGWVEYPYSQTMFASWQAGATYEAPTLEARNEQGEWMLVHEQFGYPAGMPRQMSLPIVDLPAGCTALRLRTNQEVYWDRLAVAVVGSSDSVQSTTLPLAASNVQRIGFPRRLTANQRVPDYIYADRSPFWDTRHQAGLYTAFGDALPLVERPDDALAIFGPGEELHLEFSDILPTLAEGWKRVFVLETVGWCKDMDLYTRDGETIEPLPRQFGEESQQLRLHDRYNTRYRSD